MKRITDRADLVKLAQDLGVNCEWHEPDNQGVSALALGKHFDNAGSWGQHQGEEIAPLDAEWREMSIRIFRDGEVVAEVNVATLLAWACGLGYLKH